MSTDNNFVNPTVVAMTSIFENAKINVHFDVHIMVSGDFETENRGKYYAMQEKYRNCEFMFINMSGKFEEMKTRFPPTAFYRYPPSAYYRLRMPSVLPNVDKCIYFDGDIIVRHDISELFDVNLTDYYIAGVGCAGGIFPKDYEKIVELPDFTQYVSSGVLVMNLEKMRQDNLETKILKMINEKAGTILYPDQDVINSVCYGKIYCLRMKYNYSVNRYKRSLPYEKYGDAVKKFTTAEEWKAKDPTVAHFDGHHKPWKVTKRTPFHKEWWDYARKTKLYDAEIIKFKMLNDIKEN